MRLSRIEPPRTTATGQCAALGTDGRFVAAPCSGKRRAACRSGPEWVVTSDAVRWRDVTGACEKAGDLQPGVPTNGWDSGLLRAAADQSGSGELWLAYGERSRE